MLNINEYFRLNRALKQVGIDIKQSLEVSYEQSMILYYVYTRNGQSASLVELCELLNVSRSSGSNYIKSLIDQGYLNKYRDISDERMIYVRMNEAQLESTALLLELMEEQLQKIALN